MFEYDIGFLGGGQLARMSIQAAQRMGLRCLSLDSSADSPAAQIADAVVGNINDASDIAKIAKVCARLTLENEFIAPSQFQSGVELAGRPLDLPVPGIETLASINDKLGQRLTYEKAGVPSPKAWALHHDWTEDVKVQETIDHVGFPMVIKSRFGGYDGKGTRTVRNELELEKYRDLWSTGGWLAEQFVPFKRELAVMVYRSQTEVGTFPTMETVQTDHVCDLVFQAGVDASEIAIKAVEAVHGYGLFGVELFELEDGTFQVNEIAPRPHNSGHYSLDWGGVSQFEQHVRLVMGWPCEKPEGIETCMANLMGQHGANNHQNGILAALKEEPGAHVHWYGKSESRPGRKMGHINVVGDDCVERAKRAREQFYSAWTS